ncbi:Druantia anti-phage system protein DruA [Roseovarius sp. CAU 1744]
MTDGSGEAGQRIIVNCTATYCIHEKNLSFNPVMWHYLKRSNKKNRDAGVTIVRKCAKPGGSSSKVKEKEISVISISSREAVLKRKLRRHLRSIGFSKSRNGELKIEGEGKEIVRALHRVQREDRIKDNKDFLATRAPRLLHHFANGDDIEPSKISPVIERISSGTQHGDLFRFASLTWSVPVSNGFGRRLRYLVWDENNGKLMGLIAIGDPVFNLAVRDRLIGWTSKDRSARLVNIMDAYVLGAIPPYNQLLGGKLVACLLRSRELYDDFASAYGDTTGIISGKGKKARLLAVTTSSSMGRSSVYNRLKLDGVQYMEPIGFTGGWGHFHIPDRLFVELRDYLRDIDHSYADQHRFGQGPNWRLRTTRAALAALGFKEDMLRHGIKREVFISRLAANADSILKSGKGKPQIESLLSTKEIAGLATERWMQPRAERRPDYRDWTVEDLIGLFGSQSRQMQSRLAQQGSHENSSAAM